MSPHGLLVAVGPYEYTVTVDGPRVDAFSEKRYEGEGFTYGYTDKATTEIVLNPRQSPSMMRETLWHELKHAAWPWVQARKFDEEQVCELLSPPELSVLRRNPQLVAYLVEEDDGGPNRAPGDCQGAAQ